MDVPWRIGNPTPPPFPVDRPYLHPPDIDTYTAIHEYLLAEGLQPESGAEVCYCYGQDEGSVTLIVYADYVPGCQEQWKKVLKWIVNRLSEAKLSWDVEIIDEVASRSEPSIAPFASKTADDLLKVSPLLGHLDWVAIDILNIFSPITRSKTPTLVISAKNASDPLLAPAIQEIKRHTGFVEVVLFQVDSVLPEALDKDDAILHDSLCHIFHLDKVRENPIGSSCGLKDQQISASIGFSFTLNSLEYGLTSARIFGNALHLGAKIQSPTTMDQKHDIDQANKIAKEWADLTPAVTRWAKTTSSIYKKRSPDLGDVVATSRPEHEGWLTDWCVFKVDHGKEISRHLREQDEEWVEPDQWCWTPIVQGKSAKVQRRGRSTGWTSGITNPYPSLINIRGLHSQKTDALVYGVWSRLKSDMLYSWGDLGSPVLAEGSWAKPGTLMGICAGMNSVSQLHYVTPMDVVYQSVSSIMQHDIEWPKEVQQCRKCSLVSLQVVASNWIVKHGTTPTPAART
ncbi:hypothetical protein EJ04DRAFT_524235 [Polyplosphaeria fusca]|uniref:Uncharacterized protein n=1 Tax=Polyplosphaeria fusca TaxID=682080 RepID=A0A9P4V225_9PLEO|nr:hypothetical protein EJ04DRAFT_524235 [Polyplosphaeria fusca]